MKTTQRSTVIGAFEDRQHAQQCVNELRRMGFREDQIGVASRDKDTVTGATSMTDKGTKAAESAGLGVAAGAGLGALWGIGIAAGLLPAIGPAIAGGTLATILSSAAAGAAAIGIAGALIGLGIPEEEAAYYEGEFKSGRTIVTVKADGRYDEAWATMRRYGAYDMNTRSAATATSSAAGATGTAGATYASGTASSSMEAGKKVQVREEELHVHKQPVSAGEVRVRKEVHTEHKVLEVPVKKEEIVVERHSVSGRQATSSEIEAGEEIRIPVTEEQVHVEKTPVVKEEVTVGKRQVQSTERVSGTVKKEEVKIEREGDVKVRGSADRK